MPLFEFHCRRCGRSFEEIVSLAELSAQAPPCPACGGVDVERAFSSFATSSRGAATGGGGCGSSGFT